MWKGIVHVRQYLLRTYLVQTPGPEQTAPRSRRSVIWGSLGLLFTSQINGLISPTPATCVLCFRAHRGPEGPLGPEDTKGIPPGHQGTYAPFSCAWDTWGFQLPPFPQKTKILKVPVKIQFPFYLPVTFGFSPYVIFLYWLISFHKPLPLQHSNSNNPIHTHPLPQQKKGWGQWSQYYHLLCKSHAC